jgi:iron(III) transport system substrate-binding protein
MQLQLQRQLKLKLKLNLNLKLIPILIPILLLGLTHQSQAAKKELWIYTSIYKEFATPLAAAFQATHPEYDVQIFQGGSEKIQAKVEAELLAGKPQADIMLVSDPFWPQDLEKRKLVTVQSGKHAAETNYYSVMVLICNKSVPKDQRPASFKDLALPKFDKLVQSGSPLESGTTFSTFAILSKKYGWDFIQALGKNHLASSGGNSTVIQKVESGEKKFGIVLLENALAAQKRGSPLEVIYPSDGSIPIPSVQVLIRNSPNPEGGSKFADFVLSAEGQKLLRNGFMYSVRKDVEAPEGAPPFKTIMKGAIEWTPQLIGEISRDAKEIKRKFTAYVLE